MAMLSERVRKRQLATILTNSIFLSIGVLIVVLVLQNYQVNRDVVAQEVARTKLQTQSLIQQTFNLQVNSLEITQDSYSRTRTLVEAVRNRNGQALDNFFNSIDQHSPDLAPDFRFIQVENATIWDDSNYQFYGLSDAHIEHMSGDMAIGSSWYISQAPSSLGMRYVAMRRTTVIDVETGEVVAYLYIGVVLNNSFSLINSFADSSNADEVLLAVGSEVIAATTKDQNIRHVKWLEQSSEDLTGSEYMVSRTDLTINDVPTFLSVYTIQSNDHIRGFVRSHYAWIALSILLVIGIAIYTRVWLGKRVSRELQSLMAYTDASIQGQKVTHFTGSAIDEFNKIGISFERSFKRLNEQEQQFSELLNFSLSPITLWNAQGVLERFNPAAERSFRTGGSQDQLIASLSPHIKMCAQGATLTGINTTIAGKTFRWNLSPIFNDSHITHIMAQGQDITSFIEAERQSESAREQAEESARARADFLARMSHELRTPLNGILGVSQLLKGKMENEQDVEHMEVLCNSGEHLLAVLNDILDFSKIEQGKFHIENSEFRLIELTSTVDKIFKPLCDAKGVDFVVDSNITQQQYVYSDQVRLNQIIFNLVSNAVKFTQQGRVQVELVSQQEDDGTTLLIRVRDTGIGIDSKRLKDIFEPFVQAESTTTREYGGSGLGLAIVHSLVNLMDGKIKVDSELDKGTEFTAVIPVQIGLNKEVSKSTLEIEPSSLFEQQIHVLLVEDNQTNAFIARAFCEKYGMKVTWVGDGLSAIEVLKADRTIELVLMDNQLPNLGGIEATKLIRNELELDVPIYACTADGMQETKNEFLRAGASYVIVKPIKEVALNKAFIYFKDHHYVPSVSSEV